MKYIYYCKKLAEYHKVFAAMTDKQRSSWRGQWIAWRIKRIINWLKEVDRAIELRSRPVGNYQINDHGV